MSLPLHHDRLLVEAGRKAIPLDVSIELTHHCNFRCQHCYIPDFSAPDLLSTERVLTLLEELVDVGTMYLTLTGGELFLRRDWLTIARRARELGFVLRLFSNGTLITDQVAADIEPLTCGVEISLYSMNAAVFDTITRRAGSLAKTLAGIERLRARNIEVLLKTPLMTLNRDAAAAVAAYAESIGAGFQPSPTIMAKKNGDLSTLRLRVSQADLPPVFGGPSTGCTSPPTMDGDARDDGPLCAAASRYCNITSSGDVMACNILPGSDGNIRETPFREIWEDSAWLNKVRSIRRQTLHTCSSCDALAFCGRCHAQALVEDGDLYGPSSYAQERAEIVRKSFAASAAKRAAG